MAGFMTHLILLPLLLGSITHISLHQANVCHPDVEFNEEPKSWIDALQHCRNENSSLVEIRDQTMQGAVTECLQMNPNKTGAGVWIGLERSIFGCNPSWVWSSDKSENDSPLTQNGSYPVDAYNNHCGKLILHSTELEWLDGNCSDSLPFICQKKTTNAT